MPSPRNPSVVGSEIAVEPDPDDWRPDDVAERSEEARLNEADDDSAHAPDPDPAFGQAEADEADVIEQHRLVADGDDDEVEPRVGPTSYE